MRLSLPSGALALCGLLAGLAAPARAQINVTAVLKQPGNLFADPAANRLYFTHTEVVTAVDGKTHQTLFSYPLEKKLIVEYNPVAGQFYTFSDKDLLVLNAETGAQVASVPFPRLHAGHIAKGPSLLRVNATGTRIYYAGYECTEDGKSCDFALHALDARTYERLNSVPLGGALDLASDPALERVYFTGAKEKTLTVMDTDLNKEIASLPLEGIVRSMGLDAARKRLYVVYHATQDYKIATFDSAGLKPLSTVGIADNAGFRVDPVTGGLFFVGLTYDPDRSGYINYRTVFRWDGVSLDENGRAALSNTIRTKEHLEPLGYNPATGRFYVYGNRSGKILAVEVHPPVDTAAPVVTATFTRPPDIGGWYKQNARVTLKADDSTDGLGVYYFDLPSESFDHPVRQVFSGETTFNLAFSGSNSGRITVPYTVFDYAGNRTDGSVTANIDRDAPTTKAYQKPAPGGKTLLTLAANDSGSGVTATFYRLDGGAFTPYSGPVPLDPDQADKVTFYSKDLVGYEELKRTVPVVRPGDVDGDGAVSIGDVVLLLRLLVSGGPIPPPDGEFDPLSAAGDLNGNGTLEVSDAVLILQALVGL